MLGKLGAQGLGWLRIGLEIKDMFRRFWKAIFLIKGRPEV